MKKKRKFKKSFFFLFIFCFIPLELLANNLASTPSVFSFYKAISLPITAYIIPNGKDPHHYEIKPSDLAQVEKAKKLILIAPNYEKVWSERIRENYPKLQIEILSEVIASEIKKDNPHFLNSPTRLKALAKKLNPKAKDFLSKIDQWQEKNKNELSSKSVFVFHNSLDYLLEDLEVKKIGQIEKQHGVFPSMAQWNGLIKKMNERKHYCVLVDENIHEVQLNKAKKIFPQIKWQIYRGEINLNKDESFWDWLNHLSQSIKNCSTTS